MRRILGFALLSCALVVGTADVASARGCRGGGCHSCCYSCCYTCCTSCCTTCGTTSCATCFGGVCVVDNAASNERATTILVQLPADAVLTIDGKATTSTSSVRTFRTPVLPTGETYTYTLQARLASGEVVTQQVNFRAGEPTTVRFNMPSGAVAQR